MNNTSPSLDATCRWADLADAIRRAGRLPARNDDESQMEHLVREATWFFQALNRQAVRIDPGVIVDGQHRLSQIYAVLDDMESSAGPEFIWTIRIDPANGEANVPMGKGKGLTRAQVRMMVQVYTAFIVFSTLADWLPENADLAGFIGMYTGWAPLTVAMFAYTLVGKGYDKVYPSE
jgi:hypothetical protein